MTNIGPITLAPGATVEPLSSATLKTRLAALAVLFKLRVVSLLLFASVAGLVLGAQGSVSWGSLLVLLVTGTMSASGASALNQFIEREEDAKMRRTRRRPLAAGLYNRTGWVLVASVNLIVWSLLIAWPFDPALAFFLGLGAVIYVGVYTIWLKPRTVLNIVIGGAAGSCAVLSGGAAAGAWDDPAVLALAGLVFLWTPTHFWSLSLVYRNDYMRTGMPMLPARTSPRASAAWILLHSLATGIVALVLGLQPGIGLVYWLPSAAATVWLWRSSIRLLVRPERARAFGLFKMSNAYLGLVLLTLCLDALIK